MNAESIAANYIASLKSSGSSRIYRRETIGSLKPTSDKSLQYSRSEARDIFARRPDIDLVEYVTGGRKLDSQIMTTGAKNTPRGVAVIIASTGGKWSKSRRNYWPVR